MRRETTMVITAVLTLVAFGAVMVFSASGGSLLRWHLFCAGLGGVGMYIAAHLDYHRLRDPLMFRLILLGSLGLLLLVLVPGIGLEVDGAQRWIGIGGFRFQPSELAKFALILLLAAKLTENQGEIKNFWGGFLAPMLATGLFAALVLAERDLGIPAMMVMVAFVLICIAGARWRYLIASVIPLSAGVLMLIVLAPHRALRLAAFISPWEHRDAAGWQLIQSLSAFAQGGIFGRGAGAGEQKLGYLPAAHTDFIFAVIGEEFGLIGTLAVVLLFALVVIAGMRIALHADNLFGTLLAAGITSLIGLQALFIMGVTTGLLPTKGLPLPFVSYGGTALIIYMGMVGILVNIGVQATEPSPHRRTAASAAAA